MGDIEGLVQGGSVLKANALSCKTFLQKFLKNFRALVLRLRGFL